LLEQNLHLLQYSTMPKENAQKLTSELQRRPERFSFLPGPGHAEFWKSLSVVARYYNSENADATDAQSRTSSGVVVCKVSKSVLKYVWKKTGSSNIKRHTEHCKPSPDENKKQQLLTSHFNYKTLKINDSEKLDIKNAELEFCVRDYHAFHALENDGLIILLQQFVTCLLLLKQSS